MRLSAAALATSVLAAALATSARAEPERYVMDPAHSDILFAVTHLGYSTHYGFFHDFDVDLTFDPESPADSTLSVVVRPAGVDTNAEKLDHHLQTPDFFDTDKFPELTFTATEIEVTGENTGKVTGDLTILGVTKPVTLDVTFNKAAPHPASNQPAIGFSATGTVRRSDFGMDYGVPAVGDDVKLMIEYEGTRAEG